MTESGPITRQALLEYFIDAAKPKARWRVGMEIERLARNTRTGRPIPYLDETPSIRGILEAYRDRRECKPILEGANLIGLDGPFGSITLEPGGQVEWSSRPRRSLGTLHTDMTEHLATLTDIARADGVKWLTEAVDPVHPVEAMPWMPKARYKIMGPYLGARGGLAHRMMTQSASIQVAYDYADAADFKRKFVAAARLAPLATALFANSSRIDGAESGYQSYRQKIWRDTDPARCGLPPIVLQPEFSLETWLDWVLQVPTIFRHKARGLVPAGAVPFAELIELRGCDAIRDQDWETHVSTIFTEVRSYTYLEVRSADLQPPELMFAVPALWTGLLYHDPSLDEALEVGSYCATNDDWAAAMDAAARDGLDATVDHRGKTTLRELAAELVRLALDGLRAEAEAFGPVEPAVAALERLADTKRLPVQ